MENKVLVQYGEVMDNVDDKDGLRIKVKLNQDRVDSSNNYPYAFPLMPKTFQSVPKIGEGVLIITMQLGNNQSQRFYLGPIISQPQFFEYDRYSVSASKIKGLKIEPYQQAASLLTGASNQNAPKLGISQLKQSGTTNAFPNTGDVAIVGRRSEDIILRDGEVDIRCGVRGEAISDNKDLVGKVVFNGIDPAYIQLKYGIGVATSSNSLTNTNSMINMVGGKINMISTNSNAYSNAAGERNMLSDGCYETLMDSLYRVPLGDKLVEFLNLMRYAIFTHTHPNPLVVPFDVGNMKQMMEFPLESILSEDVRCS